MSLDVRVLSVVWLAGFIGTQPSTLARSFDPEVSFPARAQAHGVLVLGPDEASVERVASSVRAVLDRADTRVSAGLRKLKASLYIIENEDELERHPALLEYLLDSRPLELIYTQIDGLDETMTEQRGIVAQKLMQLFVYYPLEQIPELADLKGELTAAFEKAIQPHSEIGQRPVYDTEDYSRLDEAHPHMGPPYYTALGAYLGLGYEVRFDWTRYDRGETEYYPTSEEEMRRWDPALAAFLDSYMSAVPRQAPAE